MHFYDGIRWRLRLHYVIIKKELLSFFPNKHFCCMILSAIKLYSWGRFMLIYLLIIDDPVDQIRFEEMVKTYKGLMFVVAKNILKQDEDAEDAVQEALWSVARNYKTVRDKPEPVLRSYLVIAAENHAKNLYKKKMRWDKQVDTVELRGKVSHLVTDNKLAECILQLPLDYREVILLKYVHGYTLKEISKIQGYSQAKAEKLNQNAKKLLKKMYEMEETHDI